MSASTNSLFTKTLAVFVTFASAHFRPPVPLGANVVPWLNKGPVLMGTGLPVKPNAIQRLLQDMDMNVDPCVDFSQFTCGGYRKNKPIPMGYDAKFFELQGKVTQILIATLGEKPMPTDAIPLRKAKSLYRSCMDEGMIASQGTAQLHNFIQHIGGWPVLGRWNPILYNLEDVLARSRPFMGPGNNALIGVTVERDIGQFGRFTLFLDQPKLGQSHLFLTFVSRDMYLIPRDSVFTMAYQQYIADTAVGLGAPAKVALKAAIEVVNLEIELAKIMLPIEEHRRADLRYKKVSIYELYLRYPQFDWLRYLRQIAVPAGILVSEKDSLVLWDDVYYDRLFKLLKNVETRIVANYIAWRTVQPLLATQGRTFQLSRLRFDALSNGAPKIEIPSRDENCARIVDGQMMWVTARIYMDRNPLGIHKLKKIVEIRDYVRLTLLKLVKGAQWMSRQSKMAATQKIQSTSIVLGYPGYLNNKFIHTYYKKFQMDDTFFRNVKGCFEENYIQSFRQLLNPHPRRWRHFPTQPRSTFKHDINTIEIAAPFFEEPWYSEEYSPALNFGGIGSIVGHLLTHTVDLEALSYNAAGLLQKTWSKATTGIYLQKAQCLIDQFRRPVNPTHPFQFHSAEKSVNENIADLVGLKVAYYAYKKWSAKRKYVDMVPGLPFTGDQLYFINAARWFCDKLSPEIAVKWELVDVFPLFQRRLVAIMQNLPEFAHAFQCPVGSPMNPPVKCHVF